MKLAQPPIMSNETPLVMKDEKQSMSSSPSLNNKVSVEILNKRSNNGGVYFNNQILLPHELFKRRRLIKRIRNKNNRADSN